MTLSDKGVTGFDESTSPVVPGNQVLFRELDYTFVDNKQHFTLVRLQTFYINIIPP